MEQRVYRLLEGIIHPESNKNIVETGLVEAVNISEEQIAVTLLFPRARDPLMGSVRRQVKELLEQQLPEIKKVVVYTKEAPPKEVKSRTSRVREANGAASVKRVIAIASGKGGVGKSTVTSNLAVSLAKSGYRVGVLDADIYGPSQPRMFGLDGHLPKAVSHDGAEYIIPPEAYGVKVASIGFFISPSDALVWRGPMATSALRQLIHQTQWGELDFLLIDLPPGTGDVHLTALQELKIDGVVVVTTPQGVALDDVVRGIEMFKMPNINIPVLGVIENMAWFSPQELPNNRYYLFGKGGGAALAKGLGLDFMGEIPIIQSVMDGAEHGTPEVERAGVVAEFYQALVEKITKKLD